MYFADFETTTQKISETKSWVWLWGIKGGQKGDTLEWGLDIKSFMDYVAENKLSPIYFHNVSFDANYIYKWLLDHEDFGFVDMLLNDRELEHNEFKWVCDERGGIYKLMVNYHGVKLEFYDSWKILMASVEKLGESIGLPKLDLDYDAFTTYERKEDVPKEAIEYLERDIDVVIKTFKKAISLYDKKMTRAAMAQESFINHYNESHGNGRQYALDFGGWVWNYRKKEKEYRNVLTREEWIMCSKSFQGGYTKANEAIINKTLETPKGRSVDVNSLYPAVMESNKMPYGRPLYSKPLEGDYITLHTILIQHAKLKNMTTPPLIKIKGGKYTEAKYYKELSYEEYTFWEEELEFIKKHYHMTYTTIKTVYFRTKYVYKDWLGEMKDRKIKAKDPVERDFHKGIYNSAYGKNAQSIFMGSRVIVEDGNHVKYIDGQRYLVNAKSGEVVRKLASNAIRYGKNGQYKHDAVFKEVEQRKYMPLASYITSKARLVLWQAQYDNLDIWLYSDTDSCYFSDEPKNLWIHESAFGAWKMEHKFTRFKVLRAKTYIFDSTHEWKNGGWKKKKGIVAKVSGLSKEGKAKLNFDNFYLGCIIKDGKRGSKNVEGGKLIYTSDFKIGEEVFI